MSKTQSKKLLYIIAAIAMLAMLIPLAAAPVAADSPPLLPAVQPVVPGVTLDPAESRDILGHVQHFATTGTFVAVRWTVNNTEPEGADAAFVGTPTSTGADVVAYKMGSAIITAYNAAGATETAEKKWGKIDRTGITAPQNVDVVWNEQAKTFEATATVTDTVLGTFWWQDPFTHLPVLREGLAAGAVLNWFLLQDNPATQAWVAAHSGWETSGALLAGALALPRATFAEFAPDGNITPTYKVTTTDVTGTNTVTILADGEEPVLVLVIPSYPFVSEVPVMIEWTKINFWTYEMEKVPQVRWAGEKIVLEKYFGPGYAGWLVRFSLENQSPGALEGLNGTSLVNLNNTAQTVWDVVDNEGFANVMLVSEAPGEVDIDLALYDQVIVPTTGIPGFVIINPDGTPRGPVINQHGFVVFYLKLEDITLSNVSGKRAGHNTGLWTPPNPWDPTGVGPNTDPDTTVATLNVSQDDLLRARVRGWFVGDNLSGRLAKPIDADPTIETGDANGVKDTDPTNDVDMVLPEGRWILPDDWPRLAGPDWVEQRVHWDIMDNPFDTIVSPYNAPAVTWTAPVSLWRPDLNMATIDGKPNPTFHDNLGMGNYYNYFTNTTKVPPRGFNNTAMLVAQYPVIGPYRPGGEFPTSFGYLPNVLNWPDSPDILRKSVVSAPQIMEVQPFFAPAYVPPSPVDLYPNGVLEWWDAPMPPAKITFKIQDVSVTAGTENVDPRIVGLEIGSSGFFKETWKSDVYYLMIDNDLDPVTPTLKVYTNPFYWIMVPASPYIPPFVNNGGYDWDSWNPAQYGPYPFWKIFNRPINEDVPSWDNSNFPTKVQVYSDNHGEAMVYVNGNWNLNPFLTTPKGSDIAVGTIVGSTTVVAMADYPYFRKHSKLVSFPVTKTWTWGGMVLGGIESADQMILTVGQYHDVFGTPPNESGESNDKLVFVWATDRDHKQAGVLNMQVDWQIAKNSGPGATIPDITTQQDPADILGISNYNAVMKSIDITHGYLEGTNGVFPYPGSGDGTQGRNWMRAPTTMEKSLFLKFWGEGAAGAMGDDDNDGVPGLDPNNFVVAAIDLLDTTELSDVNVTITLNGPDKGILVYHVNVNFASAYPLDDNIVPGDANVDGKVTMADITAIERIILGLNSPNVNADANGNNKINMGDVVKAERKILGLN